MGGGRGWERQNRDETANIGERSEHSSGETRGGVLSGVAGGGGGGGGGVFSPFPFPPPPPHPHFPCGVLSDTKKLYYYKRIRGWTSAESHCIKRTGKLNPGTK